MNYALLDIFCFSRELSFKASRPKTRKKKGRIFQRKETNRNTKIKRFSNTDHFKTDIFKIF